MKYKTAWNLGLLYKNDKDPQIEKDIKNLELSCVAFEKKYKGKDFTSTAKKLAVALKEYIAVTDETTAKPWWYFALLGMLDSDDAKAAAVASQMQERFSRATNKVTFFILQLGKINSPSQKQYLKDPLLQEYWYFLNKIFTRSKFDLTEKEEQMATLLGQTSYTMWIDGQQRLIGGKTVEYKNKQLPISEAREKVATLPKKERHQLYKSIVSTFKEHSIFAEAEINAIVNYKKVMDELRGFSKPYSDRLLDDEVDEQTLDALIKSVTKYFALSKRFYVLHAKLLKEKTTTRADHLVGIGGLEKEFNFDDTITLVKKAFSKVDPKYADTVQSFVDNGQIDIYPKKGKMGGAFCWGVGELPIYVLLNHVNNLRSVETFAHEMGHAIHGELDKDLPVQYKGHSTATAEVASTFFEQLVGDEILETLSEKEQMVLLHSKIAESIYCVMGQIAGFNYEIALHEKIRKEGQVSRQDIALLLQKQYEAYMGKAVTITPDDGYNFVGWTHTRMFFYVYSYAHGLLVSRALYEKWKADPTYAKKIEQFLSAGRSMSPKDIFKSIGITIDEAFFEAGLKGIEADINKLEKLAKKYKKI